MADVVIRRLPGTLLLRYAHLLEGGRILLGLVDPHGDIVIYIESLGRIDDTIQRRSRKILFHRDRIGESCLFALDESKGMLAVYSSVRVCLSFLLSPSPSKNKF